ncbi:hypothetical protein E2C01_007286 [Portunus trituberculatus]|uniref:Uncharacterized protein n=1 Tax=Portunus trituberculatus TaxID=210409 RepID=A0A5B7CZ14_PORTR|nr:hypothetical protein [Portunus trituberculatus]
MEGQAGSGQPHRGTTDHLATRITTTTFPETGNRLRRVNAPLPRCATGKQEMKAGVRWKTLSGRCSLGISRVFQVHCALCDQASHVTRASAGESFGEYLGRGGTPGNTRRPGRDKQSFLLGVRILNEA